MLVWCRADVLWMLVWEWLWECVPLARRSLRLLDGLSEASEDDDAWEWVTECECECECVCVCECEWAPALSDP